MAKQDDKNVPSADEIKRQKEFNALLQEENRIRAEREGRTASDIYTRDSVTQAGAQLDYARLLTEEVKDQMGMSKAKAESDSKVLGLARKLQSSASIISSELGREAAVQKQISDDRKLQRSIELELGNAITQLSEVEAANASKLAALGQQREQHQSRIAYLQQEINKYSEEDLKNSDGSLTSAGKHVKLLKEQQKIADKKLASTNTEYDQAQATANTNIQRVANLKEQFSLSTKLIADREAELEVQKEITKATGVTGAVVEGLGGIMQRLGLRSGIFNQAMEDASEAMRDVAGEAKKAGKEISKSEVALVGISKLLKGLKGGLFDPAVIGGAVLDAFFKVDAAATKIQQSTGQNVSILASQNSALATSVQFMETMEQLTLKTGRNAQNIFSGDTIAKAAEFQNTLGLSADAASELAILTGVNGQSMDSQAAAIVDTTSAFNKANRSAVSQGQILRDVAHASDGIKASLGSNPKALANAAAEARRLGMEISQLDSIAGSLLDFESSIEAELEAQLLTGKNINMAKARELALNNDLAGLGKELFKNSSDIAEFGKMNRIQQEAQAKALGMTRDQLAKVAYQRALDNGMTDEAAAKAAGVRLEDMKRVEAQEALKIAIEKVLQSLAPILDIVGSIANAIAPIIALFGKVIGLVVGLPGGIGKIAIAVLVAAKAFGGFNGAILAAGKGIGGLWSSMKSGLGTLKTVKDSLLKAFSDPKQALEDLRKGFTTVTDSFKTGFDQVGKVQSKAGDWYDKDSPQGKMIRTKGGTQSLTDKVQDKTKEIASKGEDKVKDLTGGASDKTIDAAKKSSEVPEAKSSGEKLKEFLTNLAAGLKEMASMEVVGGALALIPASIGLVAMAPGYLGAKLLEKINGEALKESLKGLADGLKSMASGTVITGALALIPASIGLVTMIPGIAGAKLLENLNGESLKESLTNLAEGLKSFAGGTAAAGALSLIPAAIGLTAMIPGVVGAKLLERLDGKALKSSLEGLANGLKAMASGSAILGALALIPAGIGFAAFTVGTIGMAAIALGGTAASAGLTALSTGLSAMANPMAMLGGLALVPAGIGFAAFTAGAIGMAAIALLGAPAAAGLTALGVGLTAFGTAAMNPLTWAGVGLLAALGVALIPLGYALGQAAPAISAFGTVVSSALSGIGGIITSIADGFSTMLSTLSMEKVASLFLLGPAFASIGLGLMSLSVAALYSLPALGVLGALALMGTGLEKTATSLSTIATSIKQISDAIGTLELTKIEELKDLISTSAMAAPLLAAQGAITGLVGGTNAEKETTSSNTDAKLDELIAAVRAGQIVKVYTDPGAIKEWMEINTSQSE